MLHHSEAPTCFFQGSRGSLAPGRRQAKSEELGQHRIVQGQGSKGPREAAISMQAKCGSPPVSSETVSSDLAVPIDNLCFVMEVFIAMVGIQTTWPLKANRFTTRALQEVLPTLPQNQESPWGWTKAELWDPA